MTNLDDLQKKLGIVKVAGESKKKEIESLKKDKVSVKTGKKGGKRPNSGRKTLDSTIVRKGIKEWMDDHALEEVPLQLMDKKTGQIVIINKPRRVIAIEKLFEIGTRGDKVTGNVAALKEWLDRYAGKPAQPIRGEGEGDEPIKLQVNNLEDILKKAYGEN